MQDPQEALTAVVTSLGDWIQAFTDTAHSNGAAPPISPTSFSIPFRRYLELIQFIVLKTGFPDPESAMPADLILVRSTPLISCGADIGHKVPVNVRICLTVCDLLVLILQRS